MGQFLLTRDLLLAYPLIDDEHQHLVALVNNLDVLMRACRPVAELRHQLDELLRKTEAHFQHEEQLMCKIDFADYELHYAEHRRLLQLMATRRQQLLNTGASEQMLEDSYEFLLDWLASHIKPPGVRIVVA